jgi:hypothetical protein
MPVGSTIVLDVRDHGCELPKDFDPAQMKVWVCDWSTAWCRSYEDRSASKYRRGWFRD